MLAAFVLCAGRWGYRDRLEPVPPLGTSRGRRKCKRVIPTSRGSMTVERACALDSGSSPSAGQLCGRDRSFSLLPRAESQCAESIWSTADEVVSSLHSCSLCHELCGTHILGGCGLSHAPPQPKACSSPLSPEPPHARPLPVGPAPLSTHRSCRQLQMCNLTQEKRFHFAFTDRHLYLYKCTSSPGL